MRFRSALVLSLLFAAPSFANGQDQEAALRLAKDLGCGLCHPGLPATVELRQKAPDLSFAGLRYNPAYLFDYLQHPQGVRPDLGPTRMPDFRLGPRESLALTLFLQTQVHIEGEWPQFPPELSRRSGTRASSDEVRRLIAEQLDCLECHTLNGEGGDRAVELTTVGVRLNQDWLKRYLASPMIYDGPNTIMPAFFYHLDVAQGRFVEMLPDAAGAIQKITDELFSTAEEERQRLRKAFEEAKAAFPEVTAQVGENIFRSQNCAACHRVTGPMHEPERNAPDLSFEGDRVRPDWLRRYLKKPTAIRPFGYRPGSGSRMPDFRLSDEEARLLSDLLLQQKKGFGEKGQAYNPRPLSVFSMAKARTLLEKKLPCLGCHQLGDQGGRIGPNLSTLKSRLRGEFVAEIIRDPHRIDGEIIMPRTPMPQKTFDLIVNYLMQQELPVTESSHLSLVDHPIQLVQYARNDEQLYTRLCAPCHGIRGDGDGYNAEYLPTQPTRHADATYMATRPDDTLFDGIFAGGYILGKSPFMPAWGQSLSHSEIWSLVRYLRQLCQCEGPAWSRDNK